MKKIANLLRKIIHRIIRILTFKKGIYGKIGRHNRFTKGIFVSENAIIGSNNYFGNFTMINNAIIGNYCSIAPNVKIGQAEHSKDFVTTYQKISKELIGFSLNSEKAVLENDVWCGANVVILQKVHIGNGAIIGANAVVTKDVPPYAIVVGVPSKIIGYRFDQTTVDKITSSKWFDYELKDAKNIIAKLAADIYTQE